MKVDGGVLVLRVKEEATPARRVQSRCVAARPLVPFVSIVADFDEELVCRSHPAEQVLEDLVLEALRAGSYDGWAAEEEEEEM